MPPFEKCGTVISVFDRKLQNSIQEGLQEKQVFFLARLKFLPDKSLAQDVKRERLQFFIFFCRIAVIQYLKP